MIVSEVIDLLERIALVDDRVVKADEIEQEAQVTMWAAVLRDVPLQFAGQAVGDHYAASAYPVMPKDIAERWRRQVRDRLDRSTGTFEPADHPYIDPDDDTGNAFVAALRGQRAEIAHGASEPVGLRELLPPPGTDLRSRVGVLVPANETFRAVKEERYPRRARPAGPPELAVHCPKCGASAGRPCRLPHNDRAMKECHPSRRDVWQAQGAATEGAAS
ncbi:zinc finger domain-containing protein [Streptomyces flaveolus]|uniref:zinc finger domain-containing protein n=1 Tax=Streptomyces flaveolus TaxID=67297 RepID=UPI0016704E30|nr:hypothetical protein [Streptomyces flaveolus]GGQ81091.1 hypothetical protein GCM10010216_48660 [Streptomyces flaveolus]